MDSVDSGSDGVETCVESAIVERLLVLDLGVLASVGAGLGAWLEFGVCEVSFVGVGGGGGVEGRDLLSIWARVLERGSKEKGGSSIGRGI